MATTEQNSVQSIERTTAIMKVIVASRYVGTIKEHLQKKRRTEVADLLRKESLRITENLTVNNQKNRFDSSQLKSTGGNKAA